MKAKITRDEALDLFREAELKWPKNHNYFSSRIENLLKLPSSAEILLNGGEVASLNTIPLPESDEIVFMGNLRGKVVFDFNHGGCGSFYVILWDDSKWYKKHISFLNDFEYVLDESREFWRVKSEN